MRSSTAMKTRSIRTAKSGTTIHGVTEPRRDADEGEHKAQVHRVACDAKHASGDQRRGSLKGLDGKAPSAIKLMAIPAANGASPKRFHGSGTRVVTGHKRWSASIINMANKR
jgi:hypothetical protein